MAWLLLVAVLVCYGYERLELKDMGNWQPVLPVTLEPVTSEVQSYSYDTPLDRQHGSFARQAFYRKHPAEKTEISRFPRRFRRHAW